MDQELDDRIRARAHAIWETEGRPDGAELDHWLRAVLELQAEERRTETASDAEWTGDAPADSLPGEGSAGDGLARDELEGDELVRDKLGRDGGEPGVEATRPLASKVPGFD